MPDYYQIIKEPMDLNRIKEKVAKNDYELRKDFLLDVRKMLDNSRVYNGDNSVITEAARQVRAFYFNEKSMKLNIRSYEFSNF